MVILFYFYFFKSTVVAANIIGARTGRFAASRGDSSQEHHGQHIPGHSLPVCKKLLLLL